jgi:hypothetical protein
MAREFIYYISALLLFLFLQLFVFNLLNFFEYGFCFIYVGFFLMLPYDLDKLLGLLIAFAVGFILDIFYQTGGIHIAASVLVMFVRPYLLNLLNPKSGFEMGMKITVSQMGLLWYLIYSALILFLHHLVIYSLDSFDLAQSFKVLLFTSVSTVFSMSMIITVQLLAFNKIKA